MQKGGVRVHCHPASGKVKVSGFRPDLDCSTCNKCCALPRFVPTQDEFPLKKECSLSIAYLWVPAVFAFLDNRRSGLPAIICQRRWRIGLSHFVPGIICSRSDR